MLLFRGHAGEKNRCLTYETRVGRTAVPVYRGFRYRAAVRE